jgi:hypothetical protein
MSPRAAGWAASLLLVALPAGVARAGEGPPRGLSYVADPSCPDQPAFAGLVLERAPQADVGPMDFEKADMQVALQPAEGRFVGTLQIRRRGGPSYAREIHGASCSEVGPAIAFILALALNGQSDARSESSSAFPDEPGANERSAVRTSEQAGGWGWAVGATIGARSGIAPSWSLTEQGFIDVRAPADGMWAPAFRIAVLRAEPVTRDDGVGTTTFSWIAGRAAGCPLRARFLQRFEFLPCMGFDIGSLRASGQPATPQGRGRDSGSIWADAFGALRLRFQLLGPLHAELEAELAVPLTQYDFAFDPRTPVYAVPPVAGAGSAGLLAQFP